MNDPSPLDSFCDALQSLQPASDQLDARQVFFAAGVEAARRSEARPARVPVMPMLAAVFAAAIITAPLAFRAGQFVSGPSLDQLAHQTQPPPQIAPTMRDTTEALASDTDEPERGGAAKSDLRVSEAKPTPTTFAFSRWLAWDAMVTATQIEREASPTLTAGHATLVNRVTEVEDLEAFRYSFGHKASVASSVLESTASNRLSVRPLALENEPLIVSSSESSR